MRDTCSNRCETPALDVPKTASSWTNDKRMVRRINDLIKDTQRESFEGIGKPNR